MTQREAGLRGRMIELGAIALFLLCSAALGAGLMLPWDTLAEIAAWLLALGASLGLPTGFLYHVHLRRALMRRGVLPEDWYWRPTELHPLLEPGPERTRVLVWGGLGALGFLVMVAGLLALAGAAVLVHVRP